MTRAFECGSPTDFNRSGRSPETFIKMEFEVIEEIERRDTGSEDRNSS